MKMVVVCRCGQKNRIKSGFVSGQRTAKAINCGHCKDSLLDTMAIQADRNADIVLAILDLVNDVDVIEEGSKKFVEEVVGIFAGQGLDLVLDKDEDDEDEEEEEPDADEDEVEDEPEPVKKKAGKKKSSKKRSH
jgi:hypothetical protein